MGEVEKVCEVYNNNTGLKSALFALKSPLHIRRMLNQDKYNELRNLFESMDSWGFQPGEDRTRDNYAPIRLIWEKIKERF